MRRHIGLTLALLAPLVAGFAWFVGNAYAPPPDLQKADGIAVLTGGADRIAKGVALLRGGYGRSLLISGVGRNADLKHIARAAGVDVTGLENQVQLGFVATSTYGNAHEIADWATAQKFSSVIIVTASYHMPRARLQLARVAPRLDVRIMPVRAPVLRGFHPLEAGPILLYEYGKFLAAWVGLIRDETISEAH